MSPQALVPQAADAAHVSGGDYGILVVVAVVAVFALLVAWFFMREVLSASEGSEKDKLGGPVSFGNRRKVGLVLDVEPALDDLQDRRPCLASGNGNRLQELAMIEAHRAPIRIAPSSRTAPAFM